MHKFESPDNLVEMLEESVAKFGENEWFGVKTADNAYEWSTYREVGTRIDNLRGGLAGLGVRKGDAVGVISNNSVEWAIACYASYGLCARYVTMYENELVSTWEYIIKDSDTKVLFVSKKEIYEKVKHLLKGKSRLKQILLIPGEGKGTMRGVEEAGSKKPVKSLRPRPDDIAGLIYTSGTTGEPKGVLLSHGNITSNIHAILKHFNMIDRNTRTLSFLPWAHSYGQVCELHTVMRVGASYGLAESPATIVNDLAVVRPTLLIAVPRIFNRVYDALHAKMNQDGGLPKALFYMGVNSGLKRRELAKQGSKSLMADLKFKVADKLVFKKIRAKFGGRLEIALTGSAAINPQIADFFNDVGVPMYEALGMTEASPGISANCPGFNKVGSCGRAFDGVTLVIDKTGMDESGREGELIVKGPNVMKGYHNKPGETKKVLTKDGGLRTGDLAYLDEDGFVFITGRIKESFKLENGKFIFPAALEAEIMMNRFVEYALVCGLNRPYTVCLVVPDLEALKKFASEKGFPGDIKELVRCKPVIELYKSEIVKQLGEKFGSYEIPQKLLILSEGFSVDNGMLTQSFKLKRKVVLERYGREIEALYAN